MSEEVVDLASRRKSDPVESERVFQLLMAERCARMIDEGQVGFEKAVLKADELGVGYRAIAKQTGRTPDSIRMFLNRKRKKR